MRLQVTSNIYVCSCFIFHIVVHSPAEIVMPQRSEVAPEFVAAPKPAPQSVAASESLLQQELGAISQPAHDDASELELQKLSEIQSDHLRYY